MTFIFDHEPMEQRERSQAGLMTAEREQSQGESLKSSFARLCPLHAGAPEGEASSIGVPLRFFINEEN